MDNIDKLPIQGKNPRKLKDLEKVRNRYRTVLAGVITMTAFGTIALAMGERNGRHQTTSDITEMVADAIKSADKNVRRLIAHTFDIGKQQVDVEELNEKVFDKVILSQSQLKKFFLDSVYMTSPDIKAPGGERYKKQGGMYDLRWRRENLISLPASDLKEAETEEELLFLLLLRQKNKYTIENDSVEGTLHFTIVNFDSTGFGSQQIRVAIDMLSGKVHNLEYHIVPLDWEYSDKVFTEEKPEELKGKHGGRDEEICMLSITKYEGQDATVKYDSDSTNYYFDQTTFSDLPPEQRSKLIDNCSIIMDAVEFGLAEIFGSKEENLVRK